MLTVMNLTNLRKVESIGPRDAARGVSGLVTAIIKVKRPGYRPAGLKVRSNISDEIFTAEFPADQLAALELDPEIVSVALSRALQVEKI